MSDVQNQGSVSATGASAVLTDDPATGTAGDKTVTTIDAVPDLAMAKNDGVTLALPGQTLVYALTVTNNGNQGATGLQITETVPANTTFDATNSSSGWSCSDGAAAGTTCLFDISGSLAGGGAFTTVSFAVTVDDPLATGTTQIVNTASVADDGGNGADASLADNVGSDTDAAGDQVNLTVVKTDGRTHATAGAAIQYKITVSNLGPDGVTGATVTDTLPAALGGATWTCAATGGATCTSGGSGNISDTVNMPNGSQIVYTLDATVSASASGSLANTASAALPPTASDPAPLNNTSTDTDTVTTSATKKADFDGDGKADILLYNKSTGDVRRWRMDGAFRLSNTLVGTRPPAQNFKIAGLGDFDGNGQADILWQSKTNLSVNLWLNGTAVTTPLGAAPIGGGIVLANADFNGDGVTDIAWHTPNTTAGAIWIMGSGTVASSTLIAFPGSGWELMGGGDFNNDGLADLLWQNAAGALDIWYMSGATRLSSGLANVSQTNPAFHSMGLADFNGDRKTDLPWYRKPEASNVSGLDLWFMDGRTRLSRAFTGNQLADAWIFGGFADYNGDGKTDVAWKNTTNGNVRVWLMNGNAIVGNAIVGAATPNLAQWEIVHTR